MAKKEEPTHKMLEVSPHNETFVALLRSTLDHLGANVPGETDVDQVMVWVTMLVPVMLMIELGEDATEQDLDDMREQFMSYAEGAWDGLASGHIAKVGEDGVSSDEDDNVVSLLNRMVANKKPI